SHLTFPVDMQEAPADLQPFEGGLGTARKPQTSPVYNPPVVIPREEDLKRAADLLNEGKKVVMLVGVGALQAREEVLATADMLASPVIKTLPGKAAVPDADPFCMGGLGL